MVTAQPSKKTSTFVSGGSASDRNLSREEPDLDPGLSGWDRGNLQKRRFRKINVRLLQKKPLRSDMAE